MNIRNLILVLVMIVSGGIIVFADDFLIIHTDDGETRVNLAEIDSITFASMEQEERDFPLTDDMSITMVWIPSGEFWMGAEDRNRNREQAGRDNAIPGHEVRISNGFWMGKYEVTQEQWEAVMGDNPAHDFGVGNDYPVYFVSWDQIQTFEAVLDNVFRLPSEAEWEYTCRAGTVTRFYWGNDPNYSQIDDYAWYSEISENQTHSVGQLRPNYWGLYDMSGNILEWTEDGHSVNYEGAPNDGSPWNEESEWSMVRGGFWDAG